MNQATCSQKLMFLLPAVGFLSLWATVASAAPAQQAYLKASSIGEGDRFGRSVAVSGDTVVVGAHVDLIVPYRVNAEGGSGADGSGAAYVFVRCGTNWIQQAILRASNAGASDYFGSSVAVSGDTIVVGAIGESSGATGVNGNQNDHSADGSGAAYIFVRAGTNWTQQAYLKASNTRAGEEFGGSVAASGDTVVVGARWEVSSAIGVNGDQSDNSALRSGAAYVFVRSGTNWSQQAYLKASNTDAEDEFGGSVAVSGDLVVVGACRERSIATGVNGNQSDNSALNSGAAYVFVRSGTNWSQQVYLKASNTDVNDLFGNAVAVSGDTVVVGAVGESSDATGVNGDQTDNSASRSGASYVFVRSGTNWSQQAYLKASNTENRDADFIGGDSFGHSVAVSGDTIAVGAIYEDSSATGLNGSQSNNGTTNSGAIYIFVRSGTNWRQQAYFKASNTGDGDFFGFAVAVSGDTVLVGATDEDSNATGVNGSGSDPGIYFNSGAAYVFTGLGVGPRLSMVSDDSGGCFIRFKGAPDVSYNLQRASNVSGPWDDLATRIAPASGFIEVHDTTLLSGQAFYRTVQP